MENQGFVGTFSRRDFMKFVGISAAGATAASMIGCAPEDTSSTGGAGEENVVSGGEARIEVINADLLVVGGGVNAMSAIDQAQKEGKHVTIIDKGPFRQGGNGAMCWDAFTGDFIKLNQQGKGRVVNAALIDNAAAFFEGNDPFVNNINRGQSMPARNEDGTLKPYLMEGLSDGVFFRHEMDQIFEKKTTTVYDRTIITDVLVNEGRCVGVMGIHLPTGNFRVFRAPATLISTGGSTWIHGWLTQSAVTNNSCDRTGDVDMALLRRGIGIGDAEYAQYDIMSIYPIGLGCAFGASMCADSQEAHGMFDVNGDPVFGDDVTEEQIFDRIFFNQYVAKAIYEDGRGTENNGIYINVGDSHIRYANERNLPLLEKFGIDARSEALESTVEMFEHGGTAVIDENCMTEIEGLFHGFGAGTSGQTGGPDVGGNQQFAMWAGHCISEYLNTNPEPVEVNWEEVVAEYDRVNEIRTRSISNGIRPHLVRQAIQKAGHQGLGVYRTKEMMENAIAELERIRQEDITKMIVEDPSLIYSIEWKEAIEAYNMLDLAELSIRASLMREETRGSYLRADFPEPDDTNWACMIVGRKVDGEIVLEKNENVEIYGV